MKGWTKIGMWCGAAGIALLSTSASAGDVSCPGTLVAGQNTYMTLSTVSGGVSCWDYGVAANPDNANNIDWGDSTPTLGDPPNQDDPLQLPFAEGDQSYWKVNGSTGTTGPLTVSNYATAGQTITGDFFIGGASASDMFLIFKLGQGTSDPSWFAFRLAAGFYSTIGDSFSIVGVGEKCNPTGTSCNPFNPNGLSHTSLFADTDDFQLVPIPAAAWLLGSGLLGLIGIGRRRKTTVAAA